MRKIYTIWFVRKATPVVGELAGFGLLVWWGLKYVSPGNILINAISAADGAYAFLMFFVRTFAHLSAPSQFASVASIILMAVIFRDVWLGIERFSALRQKLILLS